MRYPVAERFHAPQGEGLYAGTQMAFIRMVGCSVGKGVCTACDTDFDRVLPDMGGGMYTEAELVQWATPCRHICITGGEPLDRDLRPLLRAAHDANILCHVETSGTVHPDWLDPKVQAREPGTHAVGLPRDDSSDIYNWRWAGLWVTVSPKPGYHEGVVLHMADEVKVILGGLGDGAGWPTVEDALRWADQRSLVYVQPRNFKHLVDETSLRSALDVVAQHPQLRLSVQLHKFIGVR